MKKIFVASLIGLGMGAFALSAEEMTGYVSDAHCGAKHNMVSEKNTQCVEKCLKGGADAVLVSDGKVMKIDAESQEKAKKMAGEMVKVSGTVEGDTIKVDSMEKASSE